MSLTIVAKTTTKTTRTENPQMSSNLTAEQLKRIEENRQRALMLKNQSTTNNAKTTISNPAPTTNTTTMNSSGVGGGAIDSTNGKCVALEEDPDNRFEVLIGYNKAVIDLFKTISSRKYNPDTKRWNFSMKSYDELMCRVKTELHGAVKLEALNRLNNLKLPAVRFYLIDRERFECQAEYNAELQEVFKSMKTRKYDAPNKRWSFELKDYDELVNKINGKMRVCLTPLPRIVREIFKEKIANKELKESEIDAEHLRSNIDPNISKSILPFQLESIRFAIKQDGRILLADDMGLGKTIQSLAIASYYRHDWPMFVIVPSSVKFMWKESSIRWVPNILRELCNLGADEPVDDYIQVLENGRQQIDRECKIVISSYDLLTKIVDEVVRFNFQFVISDECHLLKNSKALRTRSALKLIQNSKRVLLLSGTPALSRPSELFTQVQAINPTLFNNFHEFGSRYCDGKETHFGWDYTGATNMKELRSLLEEKILMRREKKDVINQLPSKIREMVILNPSLVELNMKSLKKASNKMDENLKGMEKRGALLTYFQETCKAKSKAVCEYVVDLLESGKKFILFAHHQAILDDLQAECDKNKYEYIRIDGSTNSEKRQFLVNKFQTSEKCQCALLSITAANSGITLTEANLVVFAELFWNPGILVQAEDRAYRIGQKNSVLVQYLCAKGTADDTIWPMVTSKLEVLSKAGLTRECLSNANTVNFESSKVDQLKLDNLFKDMMEEENDCTIDAIPNEDTNSLNTINSKAPSLAQSRIDKLLEGIDMSKLDSPPMKKVKK